MPNGIVLSILLFLHLETCSFSVHSLHGADHCCCCCEDVQYVPDLHLQLRLVVTRVPSSKTVFKSTVVKELLRPFQRKHMHVFTIHKRYHLQIPAREECGEQPEQI